MSEAPATLSEISRRRFAGALSASEELRTLFHRGRDESEGAPLDIDVLECTRPPFLLPGGWVVLARARSGAVTGTIRCLYFETDSQEVVLPLVAPYGRTHEWFQQVESQLGRDVLRIEDEAAARAFFLAFADYEFRARPSEPVLAGDGDLSAGLDWITPLLPAERDRVKEVLARHPLRVERKNEDQFLVKACLLEFDRLLEEEITLFGRDRNPEGLYDRARKGEFRPGARSTLLDGLPDNYRVRPGSAFGFPRVEQAPDPDGWVVVEPDEAARIQSDLLRLVSEEHAPGREPLLCVADSPILRRQHLGFYALDLLEIRSSGAGDVNTAFVLWRPGYAVTLDGTSGPIHDVNETRSLTGAEDHRPELLQTADHAGQYLRFFCRHVWGDEGPFQIVESPDEIVDDAPAGVAPDPGTREALGRIAPPSVDELPAAGGHRTFSASAVVVFGSGLYRATFKVMGDGRIEMTDDDPITELPSRKFPEDHWATLRLATYRPMNRIPAMADRNTRCVAAADLHRAGLGSEKTFGDTLEDVIVLGRLRLTRLPTRGFRRCRFRGHVDLSSLNDAGPLAFDECVFEDGLTLADSSIQGTMRISGCVVLGGRRWLHQDDQARSGAFSLERLATGSLWIEKLATRVGIHADGLRTEGHLHLWNVVSAGRLSLETLAAQSVVAGAISAGGGVHLNHSVVQQYIDLRRIQTVTAGIHLYGAVVQFNYLAIESVRLAGDLDATFLRVGTGVFVGEETGGGPSVIAGSVDLRGAVIPRILRLAVTARHLVLDGTECDGLADLIGLKLTEGGHVEARHARFAKQLRVADAAQSAAIPGRLDLTGSTLGELTVSVKSFELGDQERVTPEMLEVRGIILKQTRIAKFTAFHAGRKYPCPIDLRYAEIQWWEFCDGSERKSDRVEDYKRLLEGDPTRQLHTYRSIEQNLVNRGHEVAADEIHWELQKWRYRAERGFWSALKFCLWTWPTSYKSGPRHLLWIILGWLVVSACLFALPENITPSEEGLQARRSVRAGQAPERWGPADGIWMAVRYHVPVVMFTARDEWEPANDRALRVFARPTRVIPWISAEGYANVVMGLHWILWPIVLITVTRKYFRRSGTQP
jgi:hypothetical protein